MALFFLLTPFSQLYKLRIKLNRLAKQAYEFVPEDDILAKLLELNMALAEKENWREPIIGL